MASRRPQSLLALLLLARATKPPSHCTGPWESGTTWATGPSLAAELEQGAWPSSRESGRGPAVYPGSLACTQIIQSFSSRKGALINNSPGVANCWILEKLWATVRQCRPCQPHGTFVPTAQRCFLSGSVGRTGATRDVPVQIPRICDYVPFPGRRDSADGIKLMPLRWGRLWISWRPRVITGSP